MRTLVAALALLLAGTAAAQPPDDATLDRLFNAMHAERLLDAIYGSVEQGMRQGVLAALEGRTPTPAQQKVLDELPARMTAVMREELSWAKLRPVIQQVYRETFTQDEVLGVAQFYESPAGRAFVDKTPRAIARTNEMMIELTRSLAQRTQGVAQQMIADLKKADGTAPP